MILSHLYILLLLVQQAMLNRMESAIIFLGWMQLKFHAWNFRDKHNEAAEIICT